MYEGLTFSRVKFYNELFASLKIYKENLQIVGNNWLLASVHAPVLKTYTKSKEKMSCIRKDNLNFA